MKDKAISFFFTNFPSGTQRHYGRCSIGDSKLIINRAKFFKAYGSRVTGDDIPSNIPIGVPRAKQGNVNFTRSFREAVAGGFKNNPKSHETRYASVRERETGPTITQGDIIENNGLVDCKVKYCGGLTLLFEWGSKDSARVGLHGFTLRVFQSLGGNPSWGRQVYRQKVGRVLKTGRLDINSKIIVPVKALIIYEEPYPVSNLLSYGRDFDLEVDTMFEEEFIGPTMVEEDDGGKEFSGDLYPRASGTEKVYVSTSPCMENIKSNGARLDGDFNNNNHGNSSPCNMNNDTHESNFLSSESPRTSGLPPPPFTKSVSAQSFVEESYGPAQVLGLNEPNSQDKNSPSEKNLPILNVTLEQGYSNVAFAYSGSVGASGGILTLWDTNVFSLESDIVDRNFVVVIGTWVGMQGKVGIMNVYAPQDRHLKEALWSSIESLLNSVNITWIVFGDFNVVRSQEERSGCRFNHGKANIFNDFIYRCRLFDFPLGGRKFTRFDRDGAKASKLDRFLANQEFFELWKDASVSVLPRTISDHCPILLKVGSPNFGPKPFKVFDRWLTVADFRDLISSSWLATTAAIPLIYS
ncbi:RNA-directed DNA polymerase, eukaryota [Tanacetum coccineum]|uniref:RNA-directed DNA polymerase, eukaryota n=1 Tax=Tanacetum coccineum TaxID=301880 RepID=A0ABQ4XRH0_9ASTR